MKIAVFGANGKMGKELVKLAGDSLFYAFTKTNNDYSKLFNTDVIIDFSTPESSFELLHLLSKESNPPALVVGTTGLNEDYFKLASNFNGKIFWSSNTSLGVAVLNKLATIAAQLLNDFDVEIVEMHHKYKIDSPSGTAITLAENIKKVKNHINDTKYDIVFNRDSKRNFNEIGLTSLRGGDIAGWHNIGFYGDGEYLKIEHNANSRIIFAKGAIKIANWLVQQNKGFYTIDDYMNQFIK